MRNSILTCPTCNAMVLSDAARCHVCDHVLDVDRVDELPTPALPTDEAVAEDLEVCTHCHETYRRGLVRCWNCGAFTRDDIKAAYDRMATDPARIESRLALESQIPAPVTQRSGPWTVESATPAPGEPEVHGIDLDMDDDLEADATDADFSFELADSIQLANPLPPTDPDVALPVFQIPEAEAEPDAVPPAIPPLPVPHPVAEAATAAPTEPSRPKAKEAAREAAAETRKSEDGDVAHSVATAGDVLLQIARDEEADVEQSRKNYVQKVRGSFVVYCPMGCRIRVQERHRGKAGKCPKCHSVFFVPRKRVAPKSTPELAAATAVAAVPTEKWREWLEEVHLHVVVPQKLRIKPDSLLKDFQAVDLGFSGDGLLVLALVANAGFMGANLKKKPAVRSTAREHLKTGGVEGLAVASHRLIETSALGQLAIAQPSPADVESLFGNIPVFGTGRIAIRLPRAADETNIQFLSFTLSEFRAFVKALESVCGVPGFGADTEVPLTDVYNTVKCHYSDAPVRELLGIEYYQQDPQLNLQITGWRCGGCGLVVSEDSRKKEKIGGLNGKAIAKAKCPKCSAKFGQHPMYEVVPKAAPASPSELPATPA